MWYITTPIVVLEQNHHKIFYTRNHTVRKPLDFFWSNPKSLPAGGGNPSALALICKSPAAASFPLPHSFAFCVMSHRDKSGFTLFGWVSGLQQRFFNTIGSWWFQWPRQPPEILLAEFGSEVRLFPLGVCQRPLPSWVPWGFQLVRHLLSCLGCCRREKIAAVCVRLSCVLVRKPAIVFFLNFGQVEAFTICLEGYQATAPLKDFHIS